MAARDELAVAVVAAEREVGEGGHRAGRCEREERILRSLLEMPRFWGRNPFTVHDPKHEMGLVFRCSLLEIALLSSPHPVVSPMPMSGVCIGVLLKKKKEDHY